MTKTADQPSRPWRCRAGWHAWEFCHGYHNQYFECHGCGARKVLTGRGGHQPVAQAWLDGGPRIRMVTAPDGSEILEIDAKTVDDGMLAALLSTFGAGWRPPADGRWESFPIGGHPPAGARG